MQGKEEGEVPF
jgi:hypothetical protein